MIGRILKWPTSYDLLSTANSEICKPNGTWLPLLLQQQRDFAHTAEVLLIAWCIQVRHRMGWLWLGLGAAWLPWCCLSKHPENWRHSLASDETAGLAAPDLQGDKAWVTATCKLHLAMGNNKRGGSTLHRGQAVEVCYHLISHKQTGKSSFSFRGGKIP